ncbi:LLM class flavin-dependent oxidoreductase [Nocardioides sp. CER19]|uniref:LLM class flavin-dependent oxidoreductase n=1 Tax=Nocardioides sp. CER19 TaxID=3038538 RepID=UPI0024479F5D|nr:LLM class flavin-dependent oxidoreductase [Nocardioides sp. CER19]MDH2416271.1 LLM class flavin-dependent oxidoreductase [Nocardioides sp. CER19]
MGVTIGVTFRPQLPPEDLRGVVEAAEAAGTHELWLWEDCFLEGGLTTTVAALAWSTRLRVGIGVLPVPMRNPAVTAMEAATVARLFPGRFVLGLGHGVQDWMRQIGAGVESPMTLLREHVTAVRDLLAGRNVDVAGRYVRLDGVALDWPPTEPPELVVAGRGPKTVALAGELADGLVLEGSGTLDDVRRARELVDAARSAAGLPGQCRIVAYTPVETRDPDLARTVADQVAALTDAGADTVVLEAPEDAPDPRPLIELVPGLL